MCRWLSSLVAVFGMFGCSVSSIAEQAKVLGSESFSQSAWMAASQAERGKMVASFFAQHDPRTLSADDVKELLGPSTAYYDYDENPAYMVGPSTVESVYGNGYILAFVTDKTSGKILDVKIIPEPGK